MNESILNELKNMLKYPSLYRHKIHSWVKSGLLLKYTDAVVDEDLKEDLKLLYRKEVEKLSTNDLMIMYSKMIGTRRVSAKEITTTIQKNWVRVSPSKRGKTNAPQ